MPVPNPEPMGQLWINDFWLMDCACGAASLHLPLPCSLQVLSMVSVMAGSGDAVIAGTQ